MWGLFTSAWVPIARVVKGELSVFVFLKTLISFHEANVSLAVINLNQLITGFVAWVRALTRKLKLYGSDSCLNSKSIVGHDLARSKNTTFSTTVLEIRHTNLIRKHN